MSLKANTGIKDCQISVTHKHLLNCKFFFLICAKSHFNQRRECTTKGKQKNKRGFEIGLF